VVDRQGSRGSRWAKVALLGVVGFLLATAIYVSSLIVQRQQALSEVSRYNTAWLVSQAEVEVARLEATVADAAVPGSTVGEDEVQLRLDIIANRVQLFAHGEVAAYVKTDPELAGIVASFRDAAQAWQTTMDRAPAAQRWTRLLAQIPPLEAPLARLAAKANIHGGDLVAQDQLELGSLYWLFSAILGGLSLCAFGLVGALTWHNRLLSRAHQEVKSLVIDLRRTGERLVRANATAHEAMEEVNLQNRILQERDHELHTQNARFDAALNNMSQALCMADAEQRLIVCNVRFLELFGLSPGTVRPGVPAADIFRTISEIGRYGSRMVEALWSGQQTLVAARAPGAFFEEDDGGRALAVSHEPMADGGWVATFEDISDRRRVEARIDFMAHHDALTSLPNRLLFHERLQEAVERRRQTGDGLALLCLDLDHFKNVNDTLGHPSGDVLLESVAQRLLQCVREDDIVARLGGDEFAILQSRADQPEAAEAMARRIVEVLRDPYDVEGQRAIVGVSVGIAIADSEATSADMLLKNADMALYRAKADGRGTYRFFETGMDVHIQARRAIELDLREALERNELELFYQPMFNLKAGRVNGFEALLRWRHPVRGMISPAQFIPVSEEVGLIVPIGAWVLARACADAALWPADMTVAVNLSPVQFGSAGLITAVRSALEDSELAPHRLELEITESALLRDSERVLLILHELRSLGVHAALDDFGTGYSSLSYLRSFPFDKIKIDQSFVREMGRRPDCLAIVNSVAGLAHKLGMTTTAEGVETEEQLAQVRDAGCTEAQGYLFDRPRPVSEIHRWFAHERSSAAA
jgi:diguanylate cyclase (GGDEF)-like protein